VHRARPQRLQLVVVFGAVELERVDAARALQGLNSSAHPQLNSELAVIGSITAKISAQAWFGVR
jgi:hypothetical protein